VSLRAADAPHAGAPALDHAAATYAPWLLIVALALTGAGLLAAF
jgi:hypothetical protein